PIGDMIARINKAYKAHHKVMTMPYSKMKEGIANLLMQEKHLADVQVEGDKPAEKVLKLTLRYQQKEPALRSIRRISKPGLRVYKSAAEIRSPLNGYGISIVSTSKGLMTAQDARKARVGGEVICELY